MSETSKILFIMNSENVNDAKAERFYLTRAPRRVIVSYTKRPER